MKALTLWQPWADALACGAKTIETRSWPTHHRGPIAIHAGFGKADPIAVRCAVEAIHRTGLGSFIRGQRGAIIGLATLIDVVPTDRIPSDLLPLRQEEHDLGDFSAGRYAWIMGGSMLLFPVIQISGAQGLWTVPPEIAKLVEERAGVTPP